MVSKNLSKHTHPVRRRRVTFDESKKNVFAKKLIIHGLNVIRIRSFKIKYLTNPNPSLLLGGGGAERTRHKSDIGTENMYAPQKQLEHSQGTTSTITTPIQQHGISAAYLENSLIVSPLMSEDTSSPIVCVRAIILAITLLYVSCRARTHMVNIPSGGTGRI